MTFLDGHPLVSTLYTCLYLRPAALAQVSSTSTDSVDPLRLPGFRNVVLRAMLLGVLKCAEIVWEELCKGLVYEVRTPLADRNDVTEHYDCSTRTFISLSPRSILALSSPPPSPRPLPLLSASSPPNRRKSVSSQSTTSY